MGKARKVRSANEIDPLAHYSGSEACEFIASPQKGHIHVKTWHRYRLEGRFKAIRRAGHWFITGAELRRFLQMDEPPLPRSPTERNRAIEQALKECKAMGI